MKPFNPEKPVCWNGWMSGWPHAVVDITDIESTHKRDEVTCLACLSAMTGCLDR